MYRMNLRPLARCWLCGVMLLALFSTMADAAVPGSAGAAEGGTLGRSIVVISDSVNITLAQGTFDGGLQPFPDVGYGAPVIRVDTPLQLVGQLVDGNYTLLSYGGGREAARRNNAVAGHGEEIRWWFAGVEQAPLPVSWRSPDKAAADDINGTFFVRDWLPDPVLVPGAGSYDMRFSFAGTRVYYPGYGEYQIYPPTQLSVQVNVAFPTATRLLAPAGAACAGSAVELKGEVRGADGALPSGGMVISSGTRTLGRPMPGGLYIDEVRVTVPGIPATVYREGFEGPTAAWAHGGEGDGWEAGTPAGAPVAYAGMRCLGTAMNGSYSHMADEWAQTPSIDLSLFHADAVLSFALWSDLSPGDLGELRVWNGTEWSDAVGLSVPQRQWTTVTVDLGKLTVRGHPLPVAGTADLMARFWLKSVTPSATVVGGAFKLDWAIPADAPAGPQFLTFKFVPDGPYSTSFAYLKVDVRAKTRFELGPRAPLEVRAGGWAEVKARLVDYVGNPLALPLGRYGGGYLQAFWDDGHGNISPAESVTGLNLTGWFAAARRLASDGDLGDASFILRFSGSDLYQPTEMAVPCTVTGWPHFELDPVRPALHGRMANLGGGLLLEDRPLEGITVTIKLPFSPWTISTTTDAGGRFSAAVRVPQDWNSSTFKVEMESGGNGGGPQHAGGLAPATGAVAVPVERRLTLVFDGCRLEKGRSVEMTIDGLKFNGIAGRVVDESGAGVKGAGVIVQAIRPGDREILGRSISAQDGYFAVPYTVGWSESPGELGLAAIAGVAPSSTVEKQAVFSIASRTVIALDDLPPVAPGGRVNVTGTLREDRDGSPGEPVRDAVVTIDFGGRAYTAVTDIGGRFRASCAVGQSSGNLPVGATYAGTADLDTSTAAIQAVLRRVDATAGVPSTARVPAAASAGPAVATTSIIAAMAGAALIGGTEAGRFKLLLAVIPLYSKIRKEEVLDQFVRGQVFGYIQANPGDHYSSIRQTLHLKNGTLAYHLRTLERENFIFSRMDGIYRRFYPTGADPARVRMKGALKETHRRMLELIEASPGITPKELAVRLGTSHQVASYHIRLMARRGRIRLETKGRNTLCFPPPPTAPALRH